MIRILTIALAMLVATTGFRSRGIWIIDAQSKLTIQGSTNVNNFVCRVEYYSGTDTLQFVEHNAMNELRFTRSRMIVPVQSFNCGARPISRDFWNTLKAERHPNLEINFVSLENVYFKDRKRVKGVVDITLAGVSTRYDICYDVTINRNGTVSLTGSHTVNFADFGLTAPRKMNGLIKVKERLSVDFDLLLKEI